MSSCRDIDECPLVFQCLLLEKSRQCLFVGSKVRVVNVEASHRALALQSETLDGGEVAVQLRASLCVTSHLDQTKDQSQRDQ